MSRDNFIAALAEQGVGTSVHFIPLHLHTVWRQSLGLSPHQFPNANDQFEHAVSLPLFSSMTAEQFQRVVDVVRKVLS